jgi:hypothetical protein
MNTWTLALHEPARATEGVLSSQVARRAPPVTHYGVGWDCAIAAARPVPRAIALNRSGNGRSSSRYALQTSFLASPRQGERW